MIKIANPNIMFYMLYKIYIAYGYVTGIYLISVYV